MLLKSSNVVSDVVRYGKRYKDWKRM